MSGSLSGVAGYDPATGTFGPAVDPAATPQADAIANGDFSLATPGTSAPPSTASRLLSYIRQKMGSADSAPPPLSFTDDTLPQQGPPAQLQGQGPGPLTAGAPPPAPPAPPPVAPQAPPDDAQLPTPPVPPSAPPAAPQADPDAAPAAPAGPQDATAIPNNGRNNPLNLRFAGQAGASNVNGFAAFPNIQSGIAAASDQMNLYAKRDGIDTLTGLISKWAPPSENNTKAYIASVSSATGIDPNAKIDISNPDVQNRIIPAMAKVENGAGIQQPPNDHPAASEAPQAAPSAPGALLSTLPGVGASGLDGSDVDGIQALLKNFDASKYQSTDRDRMLAVAAGLLQGRTFGQGLGMGLQNLGAMRQNDRSEGLKATQANVAALVADARARQQMAMLNLKTQPTFTGQFAKNANGDIIPITRDPNSGAVSLPQGYTPTKVQTADNQTARTDSQINGTTATNAALGRDTVKDNNDQADLINSKGTAAVGQIRALENFKQAVDSGASSGSDAASQFKRELALRAGINLGDTDGSSVQLANALGKQLQVQGVQGMRGLGLRTQNEFNTFVKQVAGLDQNPDVVKTLVQPLLDGANNDLKVYKAWHDPSVDQGKILRSPQGVANWRSPMDMDYAASQGVVPGQPNVPTVQKTPQGWQSIPGGVRFKVNN